MDTKALIERAYAAFNSRNIAGALKLMAENVSWPKATEGGRVVGQDDIRSYWSRQWETFDPRVDVLEIEDAGNGKVNVKVNLLVKDLQGNVLSDTEVWHEYTIRNGLIERMDIRGDENTAGDKPSGAFVKHD
jgi:hypothetical protein